MGVRYYETRRGAPHGTGAGGAQPTRLEVKPSIRPGTDAVKYVWAQSVFVIGFTTCREG